MLQWGMDKRQASKTLSRAKPKRFVQELHAGVQPVTREEATAAAKALVTVANQAKGGRHRMAQLGKEGRRKFASLGGQASMRGRSRAKRVTDAKHAIAVRWARVKEGRGK